MLIKKGGGIPYSEITPKATYLDRRSFLAGIPAAFLAARRLSAAGAKLAGVRKSPLSTTEKENSYEDVTHYNNFYEFGTQKDEPAKNAQKFQTSPWSVSVEGLVDKPRKFSMDEIL